MCKLFPVPAPWLSLPALHPAQHSCLRSLYPHTPACLSLPLLRLCCLSQGGPQGPVLYIADNARCRPNGTLASGQALHLRPRSEQNPCGFEFNLSTT